MDNINELFETLFDKNNGKAYGALCELQAESERSGCVYPFMGRLFDMLKSDNSYIRTRGLVLIAYNARWDNGYIDENIALFLEHITDEKPITARQCVKLLPLIARDRQGLIRVILSALENAELSCYSDNMRQLVQKDIVDAINEIKKLG